MKLDCKNCGVKILPTTYKKNKGLCMPCKGGYRDRIVETVTVADSEGGPSDIIHLYVKLVKDVLHIHSSDLISNLNILEQCVIELEKAAKAIFPPKKWWHRFRLGSNDNWMEGASLANCASELTAHLEGADLLEYRDRSARIWVQATLKVNSHYHHLVGPAMVANANIAQEKSNVERVQTICDAIIQDFQIKLEEVELAEERPEFEELIVSLETLEFAVNKSIELDFKSERASNLAGRLERVWALPVSEASNEINELRNFKELLQVSSQSCDELVNYLGFPIPSDLCAFINNVTLKSDQEKWFWFMTGMSYDRVFNQYVNPEEYDFLTVYGEENGKLNKRECNCIAPTLLSNELGFLDEPLYIVSMKGVVPIMIGEGMGSFILYSSDESLGKGLIHVGEAGAYFVAPSILDHVNDLIQGLESEKYTLGEGLINYPFLWHERVQVQSGIKKMNEYGDVE